MHYMEKVGGWNNSKFFEYIGLPYTHSGPVSSMLAMNKYFSKKYLSRIKLLHLNIFI